jgi:hypothetical protein
MPRNIQIAVLAAALSGLMAGCSPAGDPATQEPVELTPGLYEITASGVSLDRYVRTDPDAPKDQVCVTAGETAEFTDGLVNKHLVLHPGCTTVADPREGNTMAGTITCPMDPLIADSAVTIAYQGKIAADSVRVTSKMTVNPLPEPDDLTPEETRLLPRLKMAARNFGIRFEAVRIGDCS